MSRPAPVDDHAAGDQPAGAQPDPVARCVGDVKEFLAEHWGQRPLLRRAAQSGEDYTDLLDIAAVDHVVTSAGLRTPAFRLIKDGSPLDASTYTMTPQIGGVAVTGLADPAKILAAVDDGATLVLQGLHRFAEPLQHLVRGLESGLGHPCQVNAYFTPPGARGLAVHSDSHDVFVLQCFGSKRWEIHAPDEVWDVVLEPGDALYMPKGTPHAATAQDALSGHLTVGIISQTWRDLLSGTVRDALAGEPFDDALPVGWHRDPSLVRAALRERLDDLRRRLDDLDVEAEAVRWSDRFLTRRPPVLAGGLVDRTRLAGLADATTVRRRSGAICETRHDGDALVLLLGDRRMTMPRWLEPAVARLSSGDDVLVGDLPIDGQSRLVLVRRLVREGLLEVDG